MNDLKTIKVAKDSVIIPVTKPTKLTNNKERYYEFAHSPYTNEMVNSPEIPIPEDIEVTSTLDVKVGETKKVTVTYDPSNARGKVSFTSGSTNVATVDGAGNVTGVSAGSATITASFGTHSDTCTVTVTNIAVTNVTLNKTTLALAAGANEKLVATIDPANATIKDITWSSSDTDVATVDQTGKVVAVATGSATITATSDDNSSKKATCTVTVA